MLNAALLFNDFVTLPRIDMRKFWSWWKVNDAPVRPEENEVKIVAAIKEPNARWPEGYAFEFPDGRLFYAPMKGDDLNIDCIEEVRNAHPNIRNTPDPSNCFSNPQSYDKLGFVPGHDPVYVNELNVKTLLIKAFYGKKAPQKLLQFALT